MEMKECLCTPRCRDPRGLPPRISLKNLYPVLVPLFAIFYVTTASASTGDMRQAPAVNVLPYSRGSLFASRYGTVVEAGPESAETRTAGLDAEEDESPLPLWRELGPADALAGARTAKGWELQSPKMSKRPKRQHNAPGMPEDERSPGHRKRFRRKWVIGGILVTAVVAAIVGRVRAKRKLQHHMMREKQAAAASAELVHLLKQVQAAYNGMSASERKDFDVLMGMVSQIAERVGEEQEVTDLVMAVTSPSPARVEEYVQKNLEGPDIQEAVLPRLT
ncbi:hypothetical protein CSUI_002074 [Cystoisospora suis]|uniref:Transmembrane protein n=1 Tax=Cystoisospora suis TaxID=483139 RepID=A0A2C6L9I3_9APIC|nr:hypothetical protein CSUI_002074 [Cystoisospora suis]